MTNDELRALADAQAAEIAQLSAALRTCMWALRQPIDGWKGECERKALDEARDALRICDDSRGTVPAHYARSSGPKIALYTHSAPAAPQPEPKREPLSEWRIVDLYRQWLANRETVSIADLMRSVERAHGIGGSDAGTD